MTVLDKCGISRRGDVGTGVDHLMVRLEEGEKWDTKEGFLEYVCCIAKVEVDIKAQNVIVSCEIRAAITRLEKAGTQVRDSETGGYVRIRSYGQPARYWINCDGKLLETKLAL